ncbi:DUF2977 domain-containing protein [Pediococcus acidilactici]|uniref:DUF2977 domain-containing protein n=1 Tax=Pediococcus acidilactici TaxID=1254 RepID=A0AAW8YRM8_PEDAC|nr:DUF2977 domain-containing protein [Pediococcus acidilactici]MDV2912343.1 DUF2977 domain-containing protein [Pediococcus acidilactici]WQS17244.1 DUF2977 domain-containing protein [Pediococcus acidilactici]WQS17312.1 DUF2977 domain-containing protein [Pediococcus acidilactici]
MSTIKFELNDKNEIISYVKQGGIVGVDLVNFDDNKLPDGFYENYKPSFYLLENNEIVENPNYVALNPPKTGPSQQDKINAQIMLTQAKQKVEQDKFNAQILLKLTGGTK